MAGDKRSVQIKVGNTYCVVLTAERVGGVLPILIDSFQQKKSAKTKEI